MFAFFLSHFFRKSVQKIVACAHLLRFFPLVVGNVSTPRPPPRARQTVHVACDSFAENRNGDSQGDRRRHEETEGIVKKHPKGWARHMVGVCGGPRVPPQRDESHWRAEFSWLLLWRSKEVTFVYARFEHEIGEDSLRKYVIFGFS